MQCAHDRNMILILDDASLERIVTHLADDADDCQALRAVCRTGRQLVNNAVTILKVGFALLNLAPLRG